MKFLKHTAIRRSEGFSLLELLVVIGVIAIMMSLLLPAVTGFSSTAGRRGAVNILMNTFEQARVAALESGRSVHIVFFKNKFPEPDSLMVVRDPENVGDPYERLSKMVKLPKGVLFHALPSTLMTVDVPGNFDRAKIDKFPDSSLYEDFRILTFNSGGAVAFPTIPSAASRQLVLTEGVRGSTEAAITARKQQQSGAGGGFEVISVSRYTGRAQLDITATTGT